MPRRHRSGVSSNARGYTSNIQRAKWRRVHGVSPAVRTANAAPRRERSTRWSAAAQCRSRPSARRTPSVYRRPAPAGAPPAVPGEQVGLEEHVEAGVVDATKVLPEGVPRSELGWRRRSQAAPHKGIVAVRRDEKARPYRVTLGHRGGDGLAVAVHVDPADGNAVAHLDSPSPGGVDDGGVELDARHDRGVIALARPRGGDAAARRARRGGRLAGPVT